MITEKNNKPETNKASITMRHYVIIVCVFFLLSFVSFYSKLKLYYITNQIAEVSDVLFGEPTPTTYQGKELMPNNNQTAYFVSNYTIKKHKTIIQNYNYSYDTNPFNTDIHNSSQLIFADNSAFESKHTTRKRKHEIESNTFDALDFKNIKMLGPFKLGLNPSQSKLNEPFASLSETSSNEPFRISQTDPDPNEPEGDALPLTNDLTVLLLFAGVYALKKHLKHSVS